MAAFGAIQRWALVGSPCLVLLSGCIDRAAQLDQVCPSQHEGESAGGDEFADSEFESDSDSDSETETTGEMGLARLDVLFVIDNSGSMGPSQRKLGGAMDAIMGVLESNEVAWRIAFTTTDIGNANCELSSIENGSLVASSCRARPAEFISGATGEDVFTVSCLEECAHTNAAIDLEDPWLAGGDGTENFSPELSAVEALRCIAPMGIAGCGFEAPLEAMRRALARAEDPADPSFGWRRPDASLAVVIVSDEADCSPNPEWDEIFTTNPVFGSPNAGLCWNAGTRCSGPEDDLDCQSANYSALGNFLTDPGDWTIWAVLHPLSRYGGTLAAIEEHVQSNQWNAKVSVALFGGYNLDGERRFSRVESGDFTSTFGIDPGCSSMEEIGQACVLDDDCPAIDDTCNARGQCERLFEAMPPVRAHELQEYFGPTQGFSICKGDWGADLASFMLEATGFGD